MHCSLCTEEVYVYWVKAFIRFHGLRHPAEMDGPEVEAFLTHLADDRSVEPSTHSQSLSALLFFYGKVLQHDLPGLQEIVHTRRQRYPHRAGTAGPCRCGNDDDYTHVLKLGGGAVRSPPDAL